MDLQGTPRTILVIDDQPGLIALLQRCLSREGYRTEAVYSGGEALAWLSSHPADLLLLDLHLPDMRVEEFLLRLKQRNHQIPFIVMTGQGDERLAVNMIKQGARDYFIQDSSLTNLLPSIVTQTFEQIQQEQRLSDIEDFLQTEQTRSEITLASIGEGVFTTDSEGRVTYINRAAEELTGCHHRETLGRAIEEVVRFSGTDHHGKQGHPVYQVLGTGIPLRPIHHHLIQHPTIGDRPVVYSVSPIQCKDGRILGSVLVLRDMSDKLKLDAELLKASKLDSLGLLAGGIAHDFNNLLTAILGNLAMTRNWINIGDPLYKFLSEAEQASLRAKSLTQQLLTFAKGGSPVKKPLDVRQVIMESATFALRGSSTQCEFDFSEDLWHVEADEGQISHVTHNLVLNAHQAMATGGTVTIQGGNVVLSTEQSNNLALSAAGPYLKITFSDHGHGISPDTLPKIFDPYFSTKAEGTGLGLSTAYSVIKNHNGTIIPSSNPGEGSTFTIFLPALEERAARSTPPASLTRGQGKILVMDDELSIRALISEMLEYLGYEVHCAPDGQEAIRQFQEAQLNQQPFAAVILDLTIPGKMGGKETFLRLRELDPEVKAIVASGYSDEMDLSRYSAYGFSGAVSKPFQMTELSHLLSEMITGVEPPLSVRSSA